MLIYFLSLIENDIDKAIFGRLYEQYERRTYAVALSILHNQHDAEDAEMAAWEKIAKNFSEVKKCLSGTEHEVRAWLATVTKNAAKDERKRRNRGAQPMDIWDFPAPIDVETECEERMVIDLIHSMPDNMRTVLEMRMVQGDDFKEIGRALHCSESAARMRFYRARDAMKERLGGTPE